MKTLYFFACICFIISCSDSNNNASTSSRAGETVHATNLDTLPVGARPILVTGCYTWTKDGDTCTLSLNLKDSTVTGELAYRWKEKDRNSGTLKGVVRDSLIYADYTFQSEGMSSVREVIFKMQGDQLLEATGDRTERGNKVIYSNPSALQFTSMPALKKVACY
ncbi:MAG: hypothetical protein JWP88_325 [Flaviaesturariibacter sp.]|nr:hypothetical protein [Flaviaesturariibacter sp.]